MLDADNRRPADHGSCDGGYGVVDEEGATDTGFHLSRATDHRGRADWCGRSGVTARQTWAADQMTNTAPTPVFLRKRYDKEIDVYKFYIKMSIEASFFAFSFTGALLSYLF